MKPELHGLPDSPELAAAEGAFAGLDFAVLDIEVTGMDPEVDEIVELAAIRVLDGIEQPPFTQRLDPGLRIPCTASAVHHITDDLVAGCPSFAQAALSLKKYLGKATLVAHHAAFDRSFVNPRLFGEDGSPPPCYREASVAQPGRPWVCTWRLAHHLWPQAPEFSNQALRYWLGLQPALDGLHPHQALADCKVTLELFRVQLAALRVQAAVTLPAVVRYQAQPFPVAKLPFGAESGTLLTEASDKALQWALRKPGLDMDLGVAIEQELARRKG